MVFIFTLVISALSALYAIRSPAKTRTGRISLLCSLICGCLSIFLYLMFVIPLYVSQVVAVASAIFWISSFISLAFITIYRLFHGRNA